MAERGVAVTGTVYQLRVMLARISPLVWRRLLVPAETSVAGLHEILQTAFGWSDERLHRFTIHAVEYGLWRPGSAGFSRDARQVRLDSFGLRRGERFTYEYNLRRRSPACTGGARQGPPEHFGSPEEFLALLQRWPPVLIAVRMAEIISDLMDADSSTPAPPNGRNCPGPTALLLAASGEITPPGAARRCLAPEPHRYVYEGDREEWERGQAKAGLRARCQEQVDLARRDPGAARQLLWMFTAGAAPTPASTASAGSSSPRPASRRSSCPITAASAGRTSASEPDGLRDNLLYRSHLSWVRFAGEDGCYDPNLGLAQPAARARLCTGREGEYGPVDRS